MAKHINNWRPTPDCTSVVRPLRRWQNDIRETAGKRGYPMQEQSHGKYEGDQYKQVSCEWLLKNKTVFLKG